MGATSKTTETITVRVTPELAEEIERLQQENYGVAKSQIVRTALWEHLED